ncbi:MAG: tetratricopeptide repeat protein, partial [Alphaproteobacteria bacterium]
REAIDCLARAVAIAPAQPELHYNLGNAFLAADLFGEAQGSFENCLRLAPDHSRARTNLGIAFKEQGRLDQARTCFSDVIARDPAFADAHWNRALARLAAGDYAAGWAGYEWRRKLPGFPVRKLAAPEWDGSALDGRTLLVHSEQGLGDTIQFARYMALIRRGGGTVRLEVPDILVPLLSGLDGVDDLRAHGPGANGGDFDMQAPLMSLPGLIAPDPAETGAEAPYLRAAPDLVDLWGERLGPHAGLRVGLCWRGSPAYAADRRRSLPARHLAPLARIDGVRLISLHKPDGDGAAASGLAMVEPGPDFDTAHGAFMDSAAIIAHLDLVVTSDTAIAHLAGALGAEVWVMLAKVPDWRWGLAGETTHWYPNMRLFRQPEAGDWTAVVERIAADLEERRR